MNAMERVTIDDLLKGAAKIAVTGHVRPDGDCTGACLGLRSYLLGLNPAYMVDVYLEPAPAVFSFLQGYDEIRLYTEGEYDLCFVLDVSDAERLGRNAALLEHAGRIVCVDHHVTNAGYALENVVEPGASSTAEVLYGQLSQELLDKELAECLYTGIVHDTGVFRFSSTTAKTMEIAGKLMGMGIDFTKIIDDSFYRKTYLQSQILGRALMECIRFMDKRCIFTVVKNQDMEFYGVGPKDLDGIVDHLRTIDGVECAIFMYEVDNHMYKVSMRSNYVVDVSRIASYFGGGGHVRAAGCTMSGSIHDVVNNLSGHIEKQLLAVSEDD